MTRRQKWVAGSFALVGLLVALVWFYAEKSPDGEGRVGEADVVGTEASPEVDAPSEEAIVPQTESSTLPPIQQEDSRLRRHADGTVDYIPAMEASAELGDPDASAEDDLEIVYQILSNFRYIFKENPVAGDNAQVTAQLLGDNQWNLVLLDAREISLSSQRELLDRWGTPYRFHAITHQDMDITSAGPDLEFFTDDDVSLDLSSVEEQYQLTVPDEF